MGNSSALKVLGVIILLAVVSFISWQIGKVGNLGGTDNAGDSAPPAAVPGGMRGFNGVVESVADASLTVRVSSSVPLASQGPAVRVVAVGGDTVIERLVQKDNATIQKEQAAFMKEIKKIQDAEAGSAAGTLPMPPEPFTRERISLKEIKAGDMVLVYADEDVTTAKQFTATRISLQPSVNLPGTTSSPSTPPQP